jgi:hypothetical protein
MSIMKIGLLPRLAESLPEARRTPAGRTGSWVSRRQNALDPGFHDVLPGPAHTDRDANEADVT